jgi:hypothetical protein
VAREQHGNFSQYLSELGRREVAEGPHASIVAMMRMAKNPKIRAVLFRDVKGADQLSLSVAQIPRQAANPEAIANAGEQQKHAAGPIHEFGAPGGRRHPPHRRNMRQWAVTE